MFGLFKKKPKCRHFRRPGEKALTNMVCVIEFTPYDESRFSFGVKEYNRCGKRAFSCLHLHMMGDDVARKIDEFIAYEITLEELVYIFNIYKYNYRIN